MNYGISRRWRRHSERAEKNKSEHLVSLPRQHPLCTTKHRLGGRWCFEAATCTITVVSDGESVKGAMRCKVYDKVAADCRCTGAKWVEFGTETPIRCRCS